MLADPPYLNVHHVKPTTATVKLAKKLLLLITLYTFVMYSGETTP